VAAEQLAMLNGVRNAHQVHSRLRKMVEVDPQFKGFGTDRHRCWLGPTLSVGELARFERNHGITLPVSYRSFVTTVGDSGAGSSTGCTATRGRVH
jgi:hypothetical protein